MNGAEQLELQPGSLVLLPVLPAFPPPPSPVSGYGDPAAHANQHPDRDTPCTSLTEAWCSSSPFNPSGLSRSISVQLSRGHGPDSASPAAALRPQHSCSPSNPPLRPTAPGPADCLGLTAGAPSCLQTPLPPSHSPPPHNGCRAEGSQQRSQPCSPTAVWSQMQQRGFCSLKAPNPHTPLFSPTL